MSESGYLYRFLFLFLAVIIISLALHSFFILPSYSSGQAVSTSMKTFTDNLALEGPVMGYAGVVGTPANSPAVQPAGGYSGIEAVRLNLRLASLRLNWETGTGDDLTLATVIVTTPQGSETLPWKESGHLVRPGWSILQKRGFLPGTTANANNILEPNEVFTILVAPSANMPPGTSFTITMSLPNVQPLTVNRIVPGPLKQITDLG